MKIQDALKSFRNFDRMPLGTFITCFIDNVPINASTRLKRENFENIRKNAKSILSNYQKIQTIRVNEKYLIEVACIFVSFSIEKNSLSEIKFCHLCNRIFPEKYLKNQYQMDILSLRKRIKKILKSLKDNFHAKGEDYCENCLNFSTLKAKFDQYLKAKVSNSINYKEFLKYFLNFWNSKYKNFFLDYPMDVLIFVVFYKFYITTNPSPYYLRLFLKQIESKFFISEDLIKEILYKFEFDY